MDRICFSLAHLTALSLPPPQLVRLAAKTGYDAVGLRLIAATDDTPAYPLMRHQSMRRETLQALRETGLAVLDIEFVKITPDIDIANLESILAVGAELGARHLVTAPYDPDPVRLAERLRAVAELASDFGIRPVLEFFPWTPVADLQTAFSTVKATGIDAVGVLVDTLHFNRSRSTLAQLSEIPSSRLPYVQLCDAPVQRDYSADELLRTARFERLPPGEGGIDVRAIVERMPSGIPIALEVPMAAAAALEGEAAVALRVIRAARRLALHKLHNCTGRCEASAIRRQT